MTLVPDARISSDLRASVVALVQASIRPASVLRRRYRGLSGDTAEVAMLEEALRVSRLRGPANANDESAVDR